ncbi:hypothetical protein HDU93_001763, partial [Gonapodya sp. JEL0774]
MTISTSAGRLSGKIAFISGGASGIGAASAIAFAKEGVKGVAITDLPVQKSKAVEIIAKIEALGSKAIFVAHNVTVEEDWIKAIEESERAFGGPLDILVNSAGIGYGYPALEDLEYSDWKRMIA